MVAMLLVMLLRLPAFGSGAASHRVEVSAAAGVTGAELQALCAG